VLEAQTIRCYQSLTAAVRTTTRDAQAMAAAQRRLWAMAAERPLRIAGHVEPLATAEQSVQASVDVPREWAAVLDALARAQELA
jgi:hypothetical protein